jgi:hypothetical protein
MLWLLEVPLVSCLVAPEWTPCAIQRAKAWVSVAPTLLAMTGLSRLGVLLIIKDIVGFS